MYGGLLWARKLLAVVEILQYRANECLGELFILSAPESRIPKPGT